jgi:hypothetical protein
MDLGQALYQNLTRGYSFFGRLPAEDLVRAWAVHGRDITEHWIQEHPGTRPYGWWLCVGIPKYGERPIVKAVVSGEIEKPHGFRHTDIYGGPDFEPYQEPEEEFLERHGVLTKDEKRALAESDSAQW